MCSGSASHERIDLVSMSLCRKLKPAPFCTSYLPLPGGWGLGANGWRMCKTEKMAAAWNIPKSLNIFRHRWIANLDIYHSWLISTYGGLSSNWECHSTTVGWYGNGYSSYSSYSTHSRGDEHPGKTIGKPMGKWENTGKPIGQWRFTLW